MLHYKTIILTTNEFNVRVFIHWDYKLMEYFWYFSKIAPLSTALLLGQTYLQLHITFNMT